MGLGQCVFAQSLKLGSLPNDDIAHGVVRSLTVGRNTWCFGSTIWRAHVYGMTNALLFPLPMLAQVPTLPIVLSRPYRICRSDSAIILANRSLFHGAAITISSMVANGVAKSRVLRAA